MTASNKVILNFSGGEATPRITARVDIPLFAKVLERMQNFIAEPQGPARFRSGTVYVNHTRRHRKAVFIPFQFNDIQSYLIEATDLKFRFYKAGGVITEATNAITGITQASPGVVTSAAHGYSNGDEVFLADISGMSQLNGQFAVVAGVTANTYQLNDSFGNPIDTTGYGAYTSGGTSARIYEVTTPYAEADLERLKFTQNADTMYIVNRNYEPRKLTRTTETNWTLATYVRTADPFGGAGTLPGAVAFTDDARLQFSGSADKPETSWFSRSPSAAGAVRFDDFTTGTNASDAVIFTLAPVKGKVDSIRWITSTDKFIVAGTFGTIRRLYGATEAEPIQPDAITAKSVNAYGADYADPVTSGSTVFYIQRGGKTLRSFEYDYVTDGYSSTDRNLVSDHLGRAGLKQLVNQVGSPEIVWALRKDGMLIGLTYKEKENIAGWHRHIIGDGFVEWMGILPREDDGEQLWLIVKRTVDGQTVRHIEYVSDPPGFPDPVDFFSGKDNEVDDTERYYNALFEQQKLAIHVDASATYDGSAYGTDAGADLTVGTGGDELDEIGVIFTASAAVFTADMVGRQIWGKYSTAGVGGGRAEITSFTDSTHVVCTILDPFSDTFSFDAGDWFLTATEISGLHHLEGKTVSLITDGAVPDTEVVEGGAVSIEEPASVIHVGLRYTGIMKTFPLDQGGVSGPAQNKTKIVSKVSIRFINSAGVSFGTNLYKLANLDFQRTSDKTGRPSPLFTGADERFKADTWAKNKSLIIVQDIPQPCMVAALDVYMETSDE